MNISRLGPYLKKLLILIPIFFIINIFGYVMLLTFGVPIIIITYYVLKVILKKDYFIVKEYIIIYCFIFAFILIGNLLFEGITLFRFVKNSHYEDGFIHLKSTLISNIETTFWILLLSGMGYFIYRDGT